MSTIVEDIRRIKDTTKEETYFFTHCGHRDQFKGDRKILATALKNNGISFQYHGNSVKVTLNVKVSNPETARNTLHAIKDEADKVRFLLDNAKSKSKKA